MSEALDARYRAEGYWRGRTLGSLLRDWAQKYVMRTALVDATTRMSYVELSARADRMAAGLVKLGIQRGDRVVVQLPNIADFVVLCFALFRIGAAPVLALPPHRLNEIRHLCQLSEAVAYVIPSRHAGFDYRSLASAVVAEVPSVRHVLVAGESLSDVDEDPIALDEPDPGSVALYLLSGGTTGLPKLIPRTHDDYAYNFRASAELCELGPASVYLAALPVAHNFPLGCPGVFGTLHAGGTAVLASSPAPEVAFPLIHQEKVTITAVVPPLALLWLDNATSLPSLRLLQVGGAKLQPEVAKRITPELGCALQQVFGMAEGLLNYTRLDDPQDLVLTTQGRPMSPADEIRIVDSSGDPVAPGERGELLTRGPYTIRGYFRSEQPHSFTPDGFYRSGDLVRQLPSGHLVVEGRVKDLINRGGDKIACDEVENHLLGHPQVRDVAMVALPDRILGERSCAVVVPRDGAPSLASLKKLLISRGLATYKLPDQLVVVDALPLTNVGKVDKQRLAAQLKGER